MCPPDYFGIEYEINPWMNICQGAIAELAAQEWKTFYQTLIDLGAEIDLLEPQPGLPDLVFTANAGLVYQGLFFASRFRYRVRQRETPLFESWARARGLEVIELPEGLYFEGAGDALFCGSTLFAGYRFRSDARAHQFVAERLGVEVLPLELVDPRYYHLDTCLCPLAEDAALYYPGAFDEYGRRVLKERIGRLIEAAPEEAASFSCNAVVIGKTVILNRGAVKIIKSLEAEGFTARPLEFTEFIKSGGSAKCLTLRIDGEDAASWKYSARR